MKKLIYMLNAGLLCVSAHSYALSGYLENPVAGATESGISVVSGWHCTARNITLTIDGVDFGKAGTGTNRFDTAPVCGHPQTGFSRLISWSALAEGSHTISVYADGELLETRQFNSLRSGGQPFATGLSAMKTLPGFPEIRQSPHFGSGDLTGQTATVQWSEAQQGFVVTAIEGEARQYPLAETLLPVLISSGDVDLQSRLVWDQYVSPLVRTPLEYAAVLPGILASLPEGFPQPDFSGTTLFYLETPGDTLSGSYARIVNHQSNSSGERYLITVEFCGQRKAGGQHHKAYALYSVPVAIKTIYFDLVERQPPACLTRP